MRTNGDYLEENCTHLNGSAGLWASRLFRGRGAIALALTWFLLLALAAGGCGVRELTWGEIQAPKVTFQGLAVYPPNAAGWPLQANLLLENPNNQPLHLLGYHYELWIEGRSVAQGSAREAVNLPPLGQAPARFPILVKINAVLGFLPLVLQNQQQKLHYRLSGSFRLASVLGGLIPLPFRFQGEMTPEEGLDFLRLYLP